MDHIIFSKSFHFRTITLHNALHNDNSGGIPCHFLARMRRGSGKIQSLDGEVLHLKEHDIFYLPRGLCYHSYWTPDGIEPCVVEWESYGFLFLPEAEGNRYKMQILAPTEDCKDLFDRLCELKEVNSEAIGLLYCLLGGFLPHMQSDGTSKHERQLQAAKIYLRSHPDCKMTDLARHCCISESGLYALFRDYANTSPIKEKNKMQIERAVELLINTDDSIEQISELLRFSSAAYFRKLFKEQTGKTPTQVRKEQALKHRI